MNEKPRGLSNSTAILLGAAMISVAILYSGGVFGRLQGYQGATAGTAPTAQQPGQPAAVVPVTPGDLPPQGDPKAKVVIVQFSDFQCPFCGAVSGFQPNGPVTQQMVKQDPTWQAYETGIVNDYVKTGKAVFYYRDFAFLGQESTDASNAARCANDQGKFWEMHDKIFTMQSGENQGAFSKDKLKKMGAEIGLNVAKFNDCVDKGTFNQAVVADTDGGRASGVNGTPALFINGKMISGAVPYTTVKAEIEAALAK